MKKTLILLFIFFSISQVYAEDKVAFLDIEEKLANKLEKKILKKIKGN